MFRASLFATVCVIIAFARAAHGADASALFADGERAFAAGEYAEALRLFTAAREAGSTGPSSYYNIGVCQYRLRQFDAAEATFAMLADEFPAMRELAEYNRGLALRAGGNLGEAGVAFERARQSTDEKIVALANAQLAGIGPSVVADEARWTGYFASALGFDDNVALLNELVLASTLARLERMRAYHVLASGGWIQEGLDETAAQPMSLANLGIVNPSGSLRLNVSRYLHLSVDLEFRAEPLAGSSASAAWASFKASTALSCRAYSPASSACSSADLGSSAIARLCDAIASSIFPSPSRCRPG